MARNTRIITTQPKLFLSFLLLACFVLLTCRHGNAAPEVTGEQFAKAVGAAHAQNRKRKQELQKLASAPLTEARQKLLTQLLTIGGSLEEVLSSEPYLTYLKTEVRRDYEDFPAYLAAMPTAGWKTETLFVLKKALPPETTTVELQYCLEFYFELRKLFVSDPNILYNKAVVHEILEKDFFPRLMERYPEQDLHSKFSLLMLMSIVPRFMATMETEVFHDAWHQRLETQGSRAGLLECAIATPVEFALVWSFFENPEALEKWILEPLLGTND